MKLALFRNYVFLYVINFVVSTTTETLETEPTTTSNKLTSASEILTTTESLTTSSATCCPSGGVWTSWSQTTDCTDSCGSCGKAQYTRACVSEEVGCPCTGSVTKWEYCNLTPCQFPRTSCCSPFKAMAANGILFCGPQNVTVETTVTPPSCCPDGGIWSAWSEWSNCVGTCGTSGTANRSRSCLTADNNCPCNGDAMETDTSCLVKGVWKDWIVETMCNSTCGACGTMVLNRTCATTNCACEGNQTKTLPCALTPCGFPNTSCCNNKAASVFGNNIYCGPVSTYSNDNVLTPFDTTTSATLISVLTEKTTLTLITTTVKTTTPLKTLTTTEKTTTSSPKEITSTSETEKSTTTSTSEKSISTHLSILTTTSPTTCCPTDGIWTSWTQTTDCTDSCGSCGKAQYIRTCVSNETGCPCIGSSTKWEYCNLGPCPYPRTSCCSPFKAMAANGILFCGPQNVTVETTVTQPLCCPDGGIWSAWSEWSNCVGTCGTSGTTNRSRSCLTADNNCPCNGDAMETDTSCLVKGIWNDWIVETMCNSTCGACGTMVLNRTCATTNCACEGDQTKTLPCALTPCGFPNTSCCNNKAASVFGNNIYCGPLSTYTNDNALTLFTPTTTTTLSACPIGGIWSSWTQVTDCSDTCGTCAKITYERTCLSDPAGCPCTGNTTKYDHCSLSPCPYPRDSCCSGFSATASNGAIICGPVFAVPKLAVASVITFCPSGGIWDDWSAWSDCSGNCGACSTSTRTRNCLTNEDGCSCTGDSTESQSCLVTGKWSDWTVQSQCNGTCGGCGIAVWSRTCLNTSCQCIGDSTKTEPCGFSLCTTNSTACCSGFSSGTYQDVTQCGPLPNYIPANTLTSCDTTFPPITTTTTTTTTPSCIAGGTWSSWSNSTCTDTCGMCGTLTQTRTCTSEAAGCPCTGPTTNTIPCGTDSCLFPRPTCCSNAKRALIKRTFVCVLT